MKTTYHARSDIRDTWQAIRRGFACRCPRCGEGRLFGRFLKVNPTCENCGLALAGHRADDMPPYVVMMIVGHIVVPLMLIVERYGDWSTTVQYIVWPPLTIVLSVLLLQPVKGALIGYQWALKMHGFDPEAHPDTAAGITSPGRA